MPKYRVDDLTRLVRVKVAVCDECGCWVWLAGCDTAGYAKFKLRGKTVQVHRYAFEKLTGKTIPDGLTIDHLNCTLRRCINPAHFELVTLSENSRRANMTRWHDLKTTEDGQTVNKAQCATCLAHGFKNQRFVGNLNGAPTPRMGEAPWHD